MNVHLTTRELPERAADSLRVLQVNSSFSGGGADSQTLELALGLRELGHAVTLGIGQPCRWEPRAREMGFDVADFPARSGLQHGMIRGLAAIIRARKIQIVHAHQGRDYWPAIIAACLAGVGARVVITRHLMTRPRGFSRWLLLACGDVIAVSGAVEAVLRRELRGSSARVHQAYCGIDTNKFQPLRSVAAEQWRRERGWGPDEIAFGVVGVYNLPRGKGQLEFMEAAARLRARFPAARFVVVGYGTMRGLLEQRHRELGLGTVCQIASPSDDMPAVMGALDVLVHPAVGSDAFPLVVLEALASGKPVIASRLDGIQEQFRHDEHGVFVPPGDVPALVDAMRALLLQPATRARMGEAGRRRVAENFTRAQLARNTQRIYFQLLAR